jgi:hypothetical protein
MALPLPAMRIKSHWFKAGAPKTPEQQAGAMAFIVWRTAQQTLKRMRGAHFDIDAGAPYFAFLREVLVFLIAVTDRIAHARMAGDAREAFTVALVRGVAATLADNEADLLGPRADGAAHADAFIDLVNVLLPHYGEFGTDPRADATMGGFTPDFAFVRYLGSRLEPTLPPKDQRWVLDQVMASEAPDAVVIMQDALRNLLSTEARPRRRAGVSGD